MYLTSALSHIDQASLPLLFTNPHVLLDLIFLAFLILQFLRSFLFLTPGSVFHFLSELRINLLLVLFEFFLPEFLFLSEALH